MTSGSQLPDPSAPAAGRFDEPEHLTIARRLRDGERRARAIAPLLAAHPDLAVSDAYAIQAEYVRTRIEEGGIVRGYKIGAAPDPLYGALFEDQVLASGTTIPIASLIRPAVEVEIAFRLRDGLQGPEIGFDDVLAATDSVVVAFEIVDSRIEGTDANLLEIVADNGRAARLVLGEPWVQPKTVDLTGTDIALERNGSHLDRGVTGTVLGHPVAAVAWLANELPNNGGSIPDGGLILSGALTRAQPARRGDRFRAVIPGLGEVSCSFA